MATRRLVDQDARRDQLRQQLLLDRIARPVERILAREITRATREMVKAWEVTGRVTELPDHHKNIEATLRMAWRASIESFARRIVESVAKHKRVPLIAKNEDHWQLFVEEYLAEYGGEKIVQIVETTRTMIMRGIDLGRAEGLGQAAIAKQIIKQAPDISFQRAAVIARTETHSAGNYGSIMQAKDTGLNMAKEWVASSGGRTRDSHRGADGQTVGIDEPFVVGGERLMYPGDPRGSAAEVINCRCVQAFIVID